MKMCNYEDLKSEESKNGHVGGKSEKSLCNIPVCDFISNGVNESEKLIFFLVDHEGSKLKILSY